MNLVAIDIGSTWTKGVRFEIEPESENVRIAARAARPTTVDNLGDGFFALLGELVSGDPLAQLASGAVQLQYSSSAKGGLAVAAIGLVPEVTLEIGKTAAQSAGAKLTQVFSYRLTRRDIAGLEAAPPDILLFAGGTDGGNTEYVLANAQAIAASKIDCEIVYAGNRAAADEVAEILASKRLRVVDNLLPNFNEPNPEPAREAIRAIFLETIVKGKGLDRIMRATGAEPVPTPYAVYEYVRAIHEHVPGWQDFMLFDMGGATTDVYSAHREETQPGTLRRGLAEPDVKRTVEGDLGMRVSAVVVGESTQELVKVVFAQQPARQEAFYGYLRYLVTHPDYLPQSEEEKYFDSLLAGLCVGYAAERHAGTKKQVCTCVGNVDLQMGRDLTTVRKVVGSGGWLSRASGFDIHRWLKYRELDDDGRRILLPTRFDYYRDAKGLLPLLANVARLYPELAARTSIQCLTL